MLREESPHDEDMESVSDIDVAAILTFASVFSSFISIMESYRKFIPLMLSMAPYLSSMLADRRIARFAKAKGTRHDLSSDGIEIYELDMSFYGEFVIYRDEVATAFQGTRHMPDVMIIGLVSAYDAFLSRLLRVIINRHQELVLTSDKTIKLSELSSFASIDEARDALIEREIESVIRLSHHEQFDWMERRFTIKLREDLSVWPKFIEICERRNLFTHTGGVVSKQYMETCRAHKCAVGDVNVGTKLSVGPAYFRDAVKVIYEIGSKLCHVFWRKFAPDEREEADHRLNRLGYDLIYARAYDIAEPLLRFGTDVLKTHANDVLRRMMVVNLANTSTPLRLQQKTEEANKILDKEDWSACSNEFKVCVAAVKQDVQTVARLMKEIGLGGPPDKESYRMWPVFRGIRTNEQFMMAFEQVFEESVIAPSREEISVTKEADELGRPIEEEVPTRH
jgi:hypothetical protein